MRLFVVFFFFIIFKYISVDFINEQYTKLNDTTERVNIYNYRTLLWTAMAEFGDLIEQKNKDIVKHFLQFIR